MDIKKNKEVYKEITDLLAKNEATLEDVAIIGLSLLFSAWKNDPNKEDIIDDYIKWFDDTFKNYANKVLEEEKVNKE